jgi:iron complex transport system substrate-binding protein
MHLAKRLTAVVVAAGLLFGVAACSTGPSGGTGQGSTTRADAGAYPVTIDSALGAVTLKKQPKRVVTIGWGSQDAALALGVVPVGMQDMSTDAGVAGGILPWDEPKLHGAEPTLLKVSTDSIPYEKILALKPDVILAVYSGITSQQYRKLSDIAPTVGYPDKPWITSWQDQLSIVGKALGRTAEAKKLTERTNETIAAAARKHPEFRGKTAAFGSGTQAGNFNFYYDTDARVQLLRQLGFDLSPSVSRLGAGDSTASFAKAVSLEKMPQIDTDVLVSWYLDASTRSGIEKSPLFRRNPAVARGGYVPITDPVFVYATSAVDVLSLPWMLDRYLPLLSKAATGKSTAE